MVGQWLHEIWQHITRYVSVNRWEKSHYLIKYFYLTMYNKREAVTLSPALDSYPKYWRLAFARRNKNFRSYASQSSIISQIRCLKQRTLKHMGLKSFESYRLGTHNFFSESHLELRIFPSFEAIWCKKNVSCSTSTKKTHLHHVSHRENWRSSLRPEGDAAVHCAQLSSPELPAACKCKTWQPLLVV